MAKLDKEKLNIESGDLRKRFEELENEQLCKEKSRKPTSQGWVCPSCGIVNAPWKATCNCVWPNEWRYPTPPYTYPHWSPGVVYY